MNVPLHTLIKLTPRAYGTEELRYKADIPAVSTWRGKGSVAKHEDPPPEDSPTAQVKTKARSIISEKKVGDVVIRTERVTTEPEHIAETERTRAKPKEVVAAMNGVDAKTG